MGIRKGLTDGTAIICGSDPIVLQSRNVPYELVDLFLAVKDILDDVPSGARGQCRFWRAGESRLTYGLDGRRRPWCDVVVESGRWASGRRVLEDGDIPRVDSSCPRSAAENVQKGLQ